MDELSLITCPNKVEFIGDDCTVVLPYKALNVRVARNFENLVESILLITSTQRQSSNHNHDDGEIAIGEIDQMDDKFHTLLWQNIGETYQSSRIVRRGEVDPNSKICHGGHIIRYINEHDATSKEYYNHIHSEEEAKGWITIVEQKKI